MTVIRLVRDCPNCGRRHQGPPYDIGSGPEFCCPNCDWCWGAAGQNLDHDDALRLPREAIAQLPEWAQSQFTATEDNPPSPALVCPTCHGRIPLSDGTRVRDIFTVMCPHCPEHVTLDLAK